MLDTRRVSTRLIGLILAVAGAARTVAAQPLIDVPPDTTPPTVSILTPAQDSTTTHVTLVSAAASDDVGVFSVEILVDGSSIGTDLDPPHAIGWDTTAATDGSHTLTALARDSAGNQTTSVPIEVSVVNPGFVNEVVVPGLTAATTIAFLPDGRMLVGELTETIWVVQPGMNEPDPTPFLQVDNSGLFEQQGLTDVLPDPNFATNHYYYLFYTRGFPGSDNRNRLSRFTASGNGTVAGSEVVLWQDDVAAVGEHHGAGLAFGADGKLYFTYGDQRNAPSSQRLDTYRGKVLRINSDGSIPTDNPFHDGSGPNKDEIWAFGLRNPFRMSIDPATGRMFIGDVGGNDIEEIDLGAPGANYGWPLCEGVCGLPGVTDPIFSYPHLGRDASLTGGFVYRGNQFPPEYSGSYFFGDYVQNTIRRLVFDADGNVAAALDFWPADGSTDGPLVGDPVKFIEGPDGSLYYVDIGFDDLFVPNPAAIRRIRYVIGDRPPVVGAAAAPTSGAAPLQVAFSSAGSFDPEGAPLSFLWTFGDGTSSTEPNPVHSYAAAGPYVARLTASDGANSTLSSDIVIVVGNPPTAIILAPQDGTLFRGGDVIPFSGAATDPDEGSLGEDALSWTIVFHHEGHVHPGAGSLVGTAAGSFEVPTTGHDFQGETSYEIILSATDATDLTRSSSVTVLPEKVNLTFATEPSGLAVEIKGIRKQTLFVLDELIGFEDTIDAPDQTSGGTPYRFVEWSDGGAQSHTVVAPPLDQTFVAVFETETTTTSTSSTTTTTTTSSTTTSTAATTTTTSTTTSSTSSSTSSTTTTTTSSTTTSTAATTSTTSTTTSSTTSSTSSTTSTTSTTTSSTTTSTVTTSSTTTTTTPSSTTSSTTTSTTTSSTTTSTTSTTTPTTTTTTSTTAATSSTSTTTTSSTSSTTTTTLVWEPSPLLLQLAGLVLVAGLGGARRRRPGLVSVGS